MARRLPPLLSLQAFESAARHENFATAAKELNLSQSAVSHRVRSLESHLGYPLFERLPRGLRLTEATKAYLPSVRNAFEEILGATSGVFGDRTAVVLNIRAPITYTAVWLTRKVIGFQQEYPHIEIRLSSTIWADQTATGEADVEFRLGNGNWPGYKAQFLFRDPMIPVCSPETLARLDAPLTPQILAAQPLAHVMGPQDYWSLFFEQFGISRPQGRTDIRVDFAVAAAELCAKSNRIVLLHQSFLDHFLESDRFVVASDHEFIPEEALHLLRPDTSEQQKPEVTLFQRWIVDNL